MKEVNDSSTKLIALLESFGKPFPEEKEDFKSWLNSLTLNEGEAICKLSNNLH